MKNFKIKKWQKNLYRWGSWAWSSIGRGVPPGPPNVKASKKDLVTKVLLAWQYSSITSWTRLGLNDSVQFEIFYFSSENRRWKIFSRRLWIRKKNGKRTSSYLIYESNINLDFGLSFSTVVKKSNEGKNAAQLNFAPNRIWMMKNQLLLLHYL